MGCNCGNKNNTKSGRVKEQTRTERRRKEYRERIAAEQKRTRSERR